MTPSPVEMVFLPRSVRWGCCILMQRSWRSRENCVGKKPPPIWNDLIFAGSADEMIAEALPTCSLQVYVVRASGDGVVICHECWWHDPKSVFRILGVGRFVRLRVFTDVTNVVAHWPPDCSDIPQMMGTVLVLARDVNGQVTRHVLKLPPEHDSLLRTGGPVTALIPQGHVFPRKKRKLRRKTSR